MNKFFDPAHESLDSWLTGKTRAVVLASTHLGYKFNDCDMLESVWCVDRPCSPPSRCHHDLQAGINTNNYENVREKMITKM